MGLKLSCLRDDHPSSPKRSCKNEVGNEALTEHNGWLCGALATKTKKREQSHVLQHEKHDEDVEFHKSKNKKVLITLEDWILSSPSWSNQVIVGKVSSTRKIHPSLDAKTERFSVKAEEAEIGNSSSVKKMKKVSFRSPEVADIFVLDVSPDHAHMTSPRRGITA